jgi:chemotaxis family two-component system response regulator Rcp1
VRLLVVEDSAGYWELIREAFRNCKGGHKWDLTVARDGEKALALMFGQGTAGGVVPDIILLDWNLPKLSGSEVLQQVKAHPELRKIPILVFSTSEAQRDIHEAYRHHANCYITKSRELEALFSRGGGD